MKPGEELLLCFFRGLNVFGRGTISMFELERRCRVAFAETGLPILFVDYYDSKGNIAVLASSDSVRDLRSALFRAIPKTCAVVAPKVIEEVAQAFNGWPAPQDVPGFRWTPGVSLLCNGQPAAGDVEHPDLGVFMRISPSVVALYRKERVTERGTLHADRKGGWAAVSNRTEGLIGGFWTARSFDVMRSLLGQAHRKLASGDRENHQM